MADNERKLARLMAEEIKFLNETEARAKDLQKRLAIMDGLINNASVLVHNHIPEIELLFGQAAQLKSWFDSGNYNVNAVPAQAGRILQHLIWLERELGKVHRDYVMELPEAKMAGRLLTIIVDDTKKDLSLVETARRVVSSRDEDKLREGQIKEDFFTARKCQGMFNLIIGEIRDVMENVLKSARDVAHQRQAFQSFVENHQKNFVGSLTALQEHMNLKEIEDAFNQMRSMLQIDGKIHQNIVQIRAHVHTLTGNVEAIRNGAKFVRLPRID